MEKRGQCTACNQKLLDLRDLDELGRLVEGHHIADLPGRLPTLVNAGHVRYRTP
jgi:hypothetical protein